MKKTSNTKSVVYEPKTEEELVVMLKDLKRSEEKSSIESKWNLGATIHSVYAKSYGEDKLNWLAKESGYSKSTLHKACQFSREFSQDQMQALTAGPFITPWGFVVNNMTIGSANFMKAYQESANFREFRNAVTKLKPKKESGDGTNSQVSRRKSLRELENEIERYKELVAIKDEEIETLKAQVENLEEQIERYENPIENEEMAVDLIAD
jgi:hypothetical protein